MAWQLDVSSCAMLWHTCHSLSTELCFFSSLLFSLLFFSLICSLQQFSSFKISFPYICPPPSFAFFTYLFLFSYLEWQHKAQETGLQPAFKSRFNPLTEISSMLGEQRKQSRSAPVEPPPFRANPPLLSPAALGLSVGLRTNGRSFFQRCLSLWWSRVYMKLQKPNYFSVVISLVSSATLSFPLFQMLFL